MLKRRSKGFVMADSILALVVISLGITSLLTCQFALGSRQRNLEQRLTAARLAKEASDGYRLHHQPVELARQGYLATANKDGILVYSGRKVIMRITG